MKMQAIDANGANTNAINGGWLFMVVSQKSTVELGSVSIQVH